MAETGASFTKGFLESFLEKHNKDKYTKTEIRAIQKVIEIIEREYLEEDDEYDYYGDYME